jgi:hypothetical protein
MNEFVGVVVVDGEKTKQETIDSFVWGKKEKNGWKRKGTPSIPKDVLM